MKSFHKVVFKIETRFLNISIFAKVLLGYLVLSIALIGITSYLSLAFLRRYTFAVTIKDLTEKACVAAEVMSQYADSPADTTMKLEDLTGASVLYIDAAFTARRILPRGRRYSSADGPQSLADYQSLSLSALDRSVAERIIRDGSTEADVRRVDALGCDVLFAGVPVTGPDDSIAGALILYRRQDDVSVTAATGALITIVSMVFAALVSMGLAYLMSRHITHPLSLLTHSAQQMAGGYYGERIELNQRDELGQLGETLNDMSGRLAENIADLQNEKAKLELILSGIGEGIAAVDQNGRLLHWNNAAMELLEISNWQASDQANARRLLDMLSAAMATGERAQTQWKNGAGRSIFAAVWPVMSPSNAIFGAVGLLRDVSETERLEQLRRDYVANVSHELRTPLTGIRGMIEPLLDGCIETDAEKMDCYRVIYQETLRLEKLIGEMLDLSRLQSGRLTVELEPMDIRGILDGAVRRFRERAAKQDVALSCAYPDDLPMALGNESRIMQVLVILLDNALSFTPSGGSVSVYARRTAAHVFVGVLDTGCGIDPGDLPYIWERFYKADKSRMGTSGTGLGLAIARLVCKLMNGRIDVQSEPGKGSRFEFSLGIFFPPDK